MKVFIAVYVLAVLIILGSLALASHVYGLCWFAFVLLSMTVLEFWVTPSISCEDYE